MDFRAIGVAFLLASLPIAGCGTAANLVRSPQEDGKIPFGGVKQDVSCIQKASNGEVGFRKQPRSESEQYPQFAVMLFCAVDLPFSLIGDTLMWPYTAAFTYINQPIPTQTVTVSNTPATLSQPQTTTPVPLPKPMELPSKPLELPSKSMELP